MIRKTLHSTIGINAIPHDLRATADAVNSRSAAIARAYVILSIITWRLKAQRYAVGFLP